MMAGRSSILRRRSSSLRWRWPSASIGTFSLAIVSIPSTQSPVPAPALVRRSCGPEWLEILSLGGGIIGLERPNFKLVAPECSDRPHRGQTGGRRREIGHLAVQRRRPDRKAVLQRLPALRGVEDELHLPVDQFVDDMR